MADRPTDPNPDPYLAEHLREALAQDPRVGAVGVGVQIAGDTVVLSGTLASPAQRTAAGDLAHELLPNHRIANEIAVADLPEPTKAEHLA